MEDTVKDSQWDRSGGWGEKKRNQEDFEDFAEELAC